jgi:hypothetical protein
MTFKGLDAVSYVSGHETASCPTCEGTGKLALGVEERDCLSPSRLCIDIQAEVNGCKSCHYKITHDRPLTVEEVEELFNTAELDMLKRGTALVTAIGTVALIPWRG